MENECVSNVRAHWEAIYHTREATQVSWFRPHLETSLSFIEAAAPDRSFQIIDVGGGESTLVDDLLARGYENVSVLDISSIALDAAKARLGDLADRVQWIVADVTTLDLPADAWHVWHDRAMFHFLTAAADRAAYVERVRKSVKSGGHVIIGTFGPEGPSKCSGLDVERYSAESLYNEFGERFRLIESVEQMHKTPLGTTQQFLYCFCVVE